MLLEIGEEPTRTPYATEEDYIQCRQLHKEYGTTYFFASQLFPQKLRLRTHALYGFVRVADELVDNASAGDETTALLAWRQQLLDGFDGVTPTHPALRAFCDVVAEVGIPHEEPLEFLNAMEMDLTIGQYETYADLQKYMRGSAVAIGRMMCYIVGADCTPEVLASAGALGEAMQLTNFLRDIGEDLGRGRIYVPQEDLRTFDVKLEDFRRGVISDRLIRLIQFEIERARDLYREANAGIGLLPAEAQKPIQIASILYSRILNRIEQRGYDVFTGRARTSRLEKLQVAARVVAGLPLRV